MKLEFDDAHRCVSHPLDIQYFPRFLTEAQCIHFFNQLRKQINWEQEALFLFGKKVQVPRLVAWYADKGITYTYSGRRHDPLCWTKTLKDLKLKIESYVSCSFNSVLCNLYRSGQDSMGWHSDDEAELGEAPVIASVSLGACRSFLFKNKKSKQTGKLVLEPGSLLLMFGNCQQEWKHALPKTQKKVGERINLTFRHVIRRNL